MKNIQYIVDDKGKKIAVIMPIEEYERLLEDIHDLSIAKERINEPEEDLDNVIEELKNEGLLPHSYKTLGQERTKKIDNKDLPRVINTIKELSANPFPSKTVKLEGFKNLYRVRSGKYRIVYTVDVKNLTIIILHVRHRKDVYRNLNK